MSILFSGQQLTDVFFLLQKSMFYTFCFQQEMSIIIFFFLNLI